MKNILKLAISISISISYSMAIGWSSPGTTTTTTTTTTVPGKPDPGGGGGGGTTTTPTPQQNKGIIIKDGGATADVNKVHTKLSGDKAIFYIYAADNNNTLSSGLKSITCNIDGNSSKTITKSVFTMDDAAVFEYDADENAFPYSGMHNISCSGQASDNSPVSGSATFYSAPAYYLVKSHIEFPNGSGVKMLSVNDGTKTFILQRVTYTYDDSNWTKKPVVKVGQSIDLYLDQVTAYNMNGQVDTGVSSTTKNTQDYVLNTIQMINGTPPNVANATGCGTTPTYTFYNISLKNGQLTGKTKAVSISGTNASIGNIQIAYQDAGVANIVQQQEADGNCNDEGFLCPTPPIFIYRFNYQIVPNNFKVDLLNSDNTPIKVLYFGQGGNPSVEDPKIVRITAVGADNNTALSDFDSKCGAQDVNLQLQFSTGSYIGLKDPDGKDSDSDLIPASAFSKGVAEIKKIVVVQQSKDVPFTPNMTNEPIIPNANSVQSNMQFNGYPPTTTFYPSYVPDVNGLSNIAILRGRINAIDTDNNGGSSTISPTKVYYEFQCNYCDLDALKKVTGAVDYSPSPTQQGWYIDSTFEKYNNTKITKDMITIDGGNLPITSISDVQNGVQTINYGSASPGTYKLNIAHGDSTNTTNPTAMPSYLLYNKYWNDNVQWYTSSFIYVKGASQNDNRDYGIDTGNAKNTRGGGRTGSY